MVRSGAGEQVAVRALGTECRPGGDVVIVRERELRRSTQAEHGEAVVASDEADGEHLVGAQTGAPHGGGGAFSRIPADAQLMRKWWNL